MTTITDALGTPAGKSASRSSSDHLAELPAAYWQQYLGAAQPTPASVVQALVFARTWGRDDAESFDVVSVHFNRDDVIDRVSMER